MIQRQLPAYPLFVKDPFFSIWAVDETFNRCDTVFWHGEPKPVCGTVTADGKEYVFLGRKEGACALEQTALEITAFSTVCSFECDDFSLRTEFVSPLPPDDLETLSCPVCFLRYTLFPKRVLKEATVSLDLEERLAYNTCGDEERREDVRCGILRLEGYESAWMGLLRQLPLSHSSDEVAADWGYYYLAAETCACTERDGRRHIEGTDSYQNLSAPANGKILVAYDDLISVYYFGDPLKGYYFRNGKTIVDAIRESYAGAEKIFSACESFDVSLQKAASGYGEEYLLLLRSALRQSVAAHKLVADRKDRLLFLSKECNSDGCIATVDVSYPSSPLYLLYAPELVAGMLRPIFDFARTDAWEFGFAPHDAGVYPYCLGQVYGALNQENKYNFDNYMRDWKKPETLPLFYLFPKGSDLYALDKQMPVEECGDMLILSAAACLAGADDGLLYENFDLLERWAQYLAENGFSPSAQLCTDDFTDRLPGNANLSVKACLGLAAFAIICKRMGKTAEAEQAMRQAREHAGKWLSLCFDGESAAPLVLGGEKGSFSLKYNLVFDKLFGTHLFPDELYRAEVSEYLKHEERYGVPLDSRALYTKSDWITWAAALSDDRERVKKLLAPVVRYLRETPDRVPFADWYCARTGKNQLFRNRSVQGGLFILLLSDSGKLICDLSGSAEKALAG